MKLSEAIEQEVIIICADSEDRQQVLNILNANKIKMIGGEYRYSIAEHVQLFSGGSFQTIIKECISDESNQKIPAADFITANTPDETKPIEFHLLDC